MKIKIFYSPQRVFLLTCALGLASAWLFQNVAGNEIFESSIQVVPSLPKQPRFTETFRACGMGYVQGYVTDDWHELTEGNLGCRQLKKYDKTVVSIDSERIISKTKSRGRPYFRIYQLKKGTCIESPTIEMGIELENYLDKNSE